VSDPAPHHFTERYVGVFHIQQEASHVVGDAPERPVARDSSPPGYWFSPTMPAPPPARERREWWQLLLGVPVVLSLLTPLYNRTEPRLLGWPFFYWGQLAFVMLSIVVVTFVYQVTKVRR
jgi:hypothetical protein